MKNMSGNKLTTTLWLVASVLALIAAALTYRRTGEVRWFLVGAGFFLLAMGIGAFKRSQGSGKLPGSDHE